MTEARTLTLAEFLPKVDDELDHAVCDCDQGRTLCGLDATSLQWGDEDDDPLWCRVCVDLALLPCERCGQL